MATDKEQVNLRIYSPLLINPGDEFNAITFDAQKHDLLDILYQVSTALSNIDNKYREARELAGNMLKDYIDSE